MNKLSSKKQHFIFGVHLTTPSTSLSIPNPCPNPRILILSVPPSSAQPQEKPSGPRSLLESSLGF